MKKRFKLKSLVIVVDTSPKISHHESLRASIERLEKVLNRQAQGAEGMGHIEGLEHIACPMLDRKKAQLANDKDYKLPKRRLCVHNRSWSWHIGWCGWLRFDWNISWIARKFGTTINPDGSEQGVPTYSEYRGILGYHCDL